MRTTTTSTTTTAHACSAAAENRLSDRRASVVTLNPSAGPEGGRP